MPDVNTGGGGVCSGQAYASTLLGCSLPHLTSHLISLNQKCMASVSQPMQADSFKGQQPNALVAPSRT